MSASKPKKERKATRPQVEVKLLNNISELFGKVAGPPQAPPSERELEHARRQQLLNAHNAKLCNIAENILAILVSSAPIADRPLNGPSLAKLAFEIAAGFMAEAEKRVAVIHDSQTLVEQCRAGEVKPNGPVE